VSPNIEKPSLAKRIMESVHSTLCLYRLFNEKSCVSPSLSLYRGPSTPSEVLLCTQQRPTSDHEEEGPAERGKQGQAERFCLTDPKEALKAFDEFPENCWLSELFPLCLECQAFMSMGNQQAAKLKPNCHVESWDAFPKSQRMKIPRKRRRRAEGLVCTGDPQHNLKMTPGTPQVPLKARRPTKLHITSSPAFGECTPAVRRKQVGGKEKEEKSTSSQGLKPVWKVKLPDTSPASLHGSLSKKSPVSSRKIFSAKQECSPTDSDTDFSDYDNDLYSTDISKSSIEVKSCKTTGPKLEKKKAENVKVRSFQKAAALRVMGKIEEVEGIIRRVSLTSSDWIKDGSEEEDELLLSSSGVFQQLQIEQQRCQAIFCPQFPLDDQDREPNEGRPVMAEELHVLGDALRQRLHQTLKMEGGKDEGEEQGHITQRPLNLSHPHHFTSVVLDKSSSHSLSAGGEISPVPSPTLSVTPRTSSSLESFYPILSSPLPSSLTDVTDQHAAEISDGHRVWTGSEDDTFITLGAESCKSTAAVENDWRPTKEQFTWSTLQLKEDYLLSSGKNVQ